MSAQFSIPKPTDVDVILSCKGLGVEMAFLGAFPVLVIELLELAIGQPALECNEGNARFRGRPRCISRLAKASTAKVRGFVFGQFRECPIGHDSPPFSTSLARCQSSHRVSCRHSISSTSVSATPKIPSPSSAGMSSDDDIMRMAFARLQAWRIGVSSSFRPLETISIFPLAFFFMTAPPRRSRWMPQNLQAKDCSVGAISEHPRVALRDVLEVGQLGDEGTGRTGGEAIRDRSQASIGAGPPQRASGDRAISGADNCSATPRFAVGSVAATL